MKTHGSHLSLSALLVMKQNKRPCDGSYKSAKGSWKKLLMGERAFNIGECNDGTARWRKIRGQIDGSLWETSNRGSA